jgi:hypothetical protein
MTKTEARLRRVARLRGLRLVKRKSKTDPFIGGFMILDAANVIIAGADPIPYSLDLAGVKRALAGPVGG